MATGIQRHVTESATHTEPPVVDVHGLGRRFDDTIVIDDLDLTIPAGQFVALLGASGCGKSTLLRILAGLDTQIDGDVVVASARAVAFQAPRLMPWKRVWRNIILGLKGARRDQAMAALAEVGLTHRADVWPKVLSGGEAQRASLARALVREPDLLLLDEPFSALDALTRIKMHVLVDELWRKHGCAILLVTHDVDEALQLADRVVVMKDGQISHDATVDLERPRPLTHPDIIRQRTEILEILGVREHSAPAASDDPQQSHLIGATR
ncbi:ABC transporter ATP-binding protein [Streptomyces sp. SID6673]|nr:ABC transporter ATP-binding protein [Streptomyces sp. SID11726]NEB26131.1 ABC transporter ATP-binding protein [Streptomyces sp. SID6673]